MDGRYPSGILVVLSDCKDPAKERQFNKWYNETYIPWMERLKFVRNTRRYENLFGAEPTFRGRPKYLSLSEINHDDLKQALKEIRASEAQLNAEGKGSAVMVTKLDTMYQRIGPEFRTERTGRPVKWAMCALPGCADTTREDEWNKWYNEKHSWETLSPAIGIYDTGYRYEAVDCHELVPHHTTRYFSLYESSAEVDLSSRTIAGFNVRGGLMEDMLKRWQQSSASTRAPDLVGLELMEIYLSYMGRVIYP